jgi:regulator of sigma E protease
MHPRLRPKRFTYCVSFVLALAVCPAVLPVFAISLEGIVNTLYVALGLGLVIFFHELGHFAVAKWCDVKVERFSIGFGPILWSKKRGETEYALSAIPFGGYVKMLGQDDMDPSQMSSEEIAQDPRSYSAKSVPQRMAIISAGVIMNIITGMLFYAIAFSAGVLMSPPVIGSVVPGMPAWEAGMDYGDRIESINGHRTDSFQDIFRDVALASGDLNIRGTHRDGSEFRVRIEPSVAGRKPKIGAAPMFDSLIIGARGGDPESVAAPGTPAHKVLDKLRPGDTIREVAVAGEKPQPVETIAELMAWLSRPEVRDEPVALTIEREVRQDGHRERERLDEPVTIAPHPFRTLGLWMDITKITDVAKNSPAAAAGLRVGDKITRVDGKTVGTEIDPLRLPDYFSPDAPGEEKEVDVTVSRAQDEGGAQEVTVTVRPKFSPGWATVMPGPNLPVDVPALGIAYHVIPYVLKVEEGSPAAKAGIQPRERLNKLVLLPPKPAAGKTDGEEPEPLEITFGEKEDGKPIMNWAWAFRAMQLSPTREVRLTVSNADGKTREVTLEPHDAADWYQPGLRGLRTEPLSMVQQADGVLDAIVMGIDNTKDRAVDIYLTLRGLFTRRISPLEFRGPVQIAQIGYAIAQQGLPELLAFLGFLSVNLAVLNFLPIPVLDGGHMVFLIWEGVTRSKPSERVVWAAQAAGFLFIVGLMLFVLFLDLFVHGG